MKIETITNCCDRELLVQQNFEKTVTVQIRSTLAEESLTTVLDMEEAKKLRDYLTEALEPQKFYLKLFDSTYGYVNRLRNIEGATGQYMSSTDSEGTSSWQTQFT